MRIAGRVVMCLVDTGATVTLINRYEIDVKANDIMNSDLKLRSYSREVIPVLSKVACKLEF